jgi:hypothetical protein
LCVLCLCRYATQDVDSAISSGGGGQQQKDLQDSGDSSGSVGSDGSSSSSECPYAGVRRMLSQLQLGEGARVRPCARRSLRICKANATTTLALPQPEPEQDEGTAAGDDGSGLLRLHGPCVQLFVSNNQGVEHRDARCVLPEETCSFALVRAMIGYRVSSPFLAEALEAIDDPTSTTVRVLYCTLLYCTVLYCTVLYSSSAAAAHTHACAY